MLQNIVQCTCAEGVARSGGFDGVLLKEGRRLNTEIFVIRAAAVFSHGDKHKRNIIFLTDHGSPFVIVCGSEEKFHFIVGNLQHVAFRHAVFDFFSGVVQRLPERRAEIGVESYDTSGLLRQFDGVAGCLADALMSGRECAEVENTGVFDKLLLHLVFGQHHVRAGITVEGKIPVAIRIGVDKGKGGVDVFIHDQIPCVDSHLFHSGLQLVAEHIFSHFADESRLLAKAFQHGKNITGSAAGVGLHERIAL